MCGRYAMGIRASFIRQQLQEEGLPVEDAPEDEEVRETYNFAPGSYGLVYRADIPDRGLSSEDNGHNDELSFSNGTEQGEVSKEGEVGFSPTPKKSSKKDSQNPAPITVTEQLPPDQDIHYHLKAMKWGLIPFWTKRSPDYGSMMRTINCRDDSLIENRGMWNTMKQRKRCIIFCQGFYEWLKKGPGGKEKIPHFVKRKDAKLMAFAGLWDCVKYEDSEEKLYTYTIITTDSNKQLRFLHDRMPVIFDTGSKQMETWLDPKKNTWSKELQSLLKPYPGELDCYPVNKEVGKVGNNSPDFIVPINSKENKSNIANFFGNTLKSGDTKEQAMMKDETKTSPETKAEKEVKVEHGTDPRDTKDQDGSENNAPMPAPMEKLPTAGMKRSRSPEQDDAKPAKYIKAESSPVRSTSASDQPKKTRSATSNNTKLRASSKKASDGTQKITNFFVK